jgi:outer membrane protein assembly factor BamB
MSYVKQRKLEPACIWVGAVTLVLSLGIVQAQPLSSSAAPEPQDEPGSYWPGFRGPNAGGLAGDHPTPEDWDLETGHNVAWKTPIPGLGHSSPVVWNERVCLTTATTEGDQSLRVGMSGNIVPVDDESVHSWQVICLDKRSGDVLWQREVHRGVPAVKRHPKATHANSTLATDGEHLVAFFGSEGLYCYDMEGNLQWQRSLGVLDSAFFMVPSAQWGFASSPVIHAGRVIVQADVLNGSFIAAFDVDDGDELWRTERDDVPTWSTPVIHEAAARTQIIVNGYRHIGGYDLTSGAELWRMTGGGDIPVPTPVVSDDLIFITNAHGYMSPVYAIRASAAGDISLATGESSNPHIAWSQPREGAYLPTPVVYGDLLYLLRDNGVLAVYRRETGERLYRQRLGPGGSGFSASPVAADGKIYFTSEDGDVYVVRAGTEFELLSHNDMGEVCMATPAISEGVLFYRTRSHLIAISEPT